MTLRNITIDNSVRYVPIVQKAKEIRAGSLSRKQTKVFHKTVKNS